MLQPKKYLHNVIDTDLLQDELYTAGAVENVTREGDEVTFTAVLLRQTIQPNGLYFGDEVDSGRRLHFRLRFYNHGVLRLQASLAPRNFTDDSPMLQWDSSLATQTARLEQSPGGWRVAGRDGAYINLGIETAEASSQGAEAGGILPEDLAFTSQEASTAHGRFDLALSPDGRVDLRFQSLDQFMPIVRDAFPALYLKRGDGSALTGFSLHASPGEHFCGAGERFERPDLFGRQLDLVNFDAAGVNNPRAYKNIPFLMSSRGYGIFVHSPAKMRLDIGAHSTRALQWLVEDDLLDVFFIGGGSLGEVLRNYRRITGFPAMPPLWSFGVWMSRASYYSDAETSEVARRLRLEGYPTDVIHLDVGWFKQEWMCDWQFNPQTFPDPQGFLRRMDEQGFQVSLWQYPYIQPKLDLARIALENGYVGKETPASVRHWLGYTLDFTHPETVAWYQGLIANLLEMGAAAIKADFGEEVDEGALYAGMDAEKYHNLFSLLYQRAVWEVTERVKGKGNAVIWARAGWAGSQRYPVHWGGDAACTFDGLAGTILGGLHFGLSGFSFWSHDVGGIHGIPDFMHTRPSDEVYVRWTQVGVFTSHMRYHGGTPREPWEYPAVSAIVRQWLRFRYALLPYLLAQSQASIASGLPVFRSLVLDWPDDPAVWSIPDEYLFGDDFLVCPVLNAEGVRDVYLPEGKWVDFWSGEILEGPLHLRGVASPLARLPLYLRYGSRVTFAEPVDNTRLLSQAQTVGIAFDSAYRGFDASPLKAWLDFGPPAGQDSPSIL